jgi:hypothetical protein
MTSHLEAKHGRSKGAIVVKVKRQPALQPLATNTHGSTATAIPANNVGSESVIADVKFPLCDAAVRKGEGSKWELADAILAECSEPGENGVRNGTNEKMEAMRKEIATNRGVDLSVERIRKLRKAASTFPPCRRRPAVSLGGHLEAGTPEALDALINGAPKGTALTCAYIRLQKYPTEKAEQGQQKEERRRQEADQQKTLQGLCRQLEREKEQVDEEKDEYKQRYAELCRTVGKEPEPFAPPLAPANEPTLTVGDDLEQAFRRVLVSRGFDPALLKQAIEELVKAALAQQP